MGRMLSAAVLAVAIFALLGLQSSCLAGSGADSDGLLFRGRIPGGSSILPLQHRYAHMEGSSYQTGGRHMTWQHYELLKRHDRSRARRFHTGTATFPLGGQADAQGLYYTEVKLGTPPRTFRVQVDTGSDLMWVYCSPCSSCPTRASGLGFERQQYDPQRSSTSEDVGCGEAICDQVVGSNSSSESCVGALCEYKLTYGDQSSTSGYVVSDLLTYRELRENSTAVNASARVVFGCGNEQAGDLVRPDLAVDGIIGFGQSGGSISSQLYSLGRSPNVFAHCLEGEGRGGGILVLGSVEEPNLIYTPMVAGQIHYNVYLEGIAVDGVNLTIDPSAFATSRRGGTGTIFDSGTTLAVLSSIAYVPTFNAIRSKIKSGVREKQVEGVDCYLLPSGSKPDEYFPSMTLYFRGAPMQLSPRNYLFELEGRNIWCLGWEESLEESLDFPLTILGDIVLKNRLVEYDNVNKRIGFVDYDCSSSVTVSADQDRVTENAGSIGGTATREL